MKISLLLLVVVLNVEAQLNTFVFGSLGESPYKPSVDIEQSTAIPQVGFRLEYRAGHFSPYSKTSIGHYNHGLLFEEFLGINAGLDVNVIRPSISMGIGVLSANEKRFPIFESDEYRTKRKFYFPVGFGIRADVFNIVYAELDARINGYPWWKVELGYKLGGFVRRGHQEISKWH